MTQGIPVRPAGVPDPPRPILVVEDSPEDAEMTVRALKKSHIANPIDVVGDGEQALNYLTVRRSHLVRSAFPVLALIDLKLPKVDGFELLLRMQQDAELRKMPVIVVTSSKEQEDALQSYSLGARSFVRKPVEFSQFNKAVSKLGITWLLISEPTS